MPGSEKVNANLTLWQGLTMRALKRAINSYTKKSQIYAKQRHPWENQSFKTEGDFGNATTWEGSTIYGSLAFMSPPSKEGSKGYWLENPHGTVRAYGVGPAFGTDFVILERAIAHNLPGLRKKLWLIMMGKSAGVSATREFD